MAIPKAIKDQLLRLLQEEEVDLHILTLHYRNNGDLGYFDAPDREKVKKIFDILIGDTKKHAQIIRGILDADQES